MSKVSIFASKVVLVPLAVLKTNPRNSRKHPEQQISQLMASVSMFGFICPILVDESMSVLAGHGRLEAAKRLGIREIPTIQVTHLTEEQKRAFIIADNRLAEHSKWDRDMLAEELKFLNSTDLSVEVTGFSTAEIDMMLDPKPTPIANPDDVVPEVDPAKAVTQMGDLWVMDQHKLLCADSTDPSAYRHLMPSERALMIFIDPPYNVRIGGHVCGLGKIKHREFGMASGEMTPDEFADFLSQCFALLRRYSSDGSIHYICMDWRHLPELFEAAGQNYTEFKQMIVWNKDNAGMGAFYRSKHEIICVYKNGTAKHTNNFGLGENGRYRTNVWDYPGVNSLKGNRRQDLELHPTVKPVALVADAMRDCSKRGSIVLDSFMGSGTTIIAAERTGRCARGIELDPIYVDVAIRRWQQLTGKTAILQATGQSFAEVEAERTPAQTEAVHD